MWAVWCQLHLLSPRPCRCTYSVEFEVLHCILLVPQVIEMRERACWVTHWVEDSVDCLLHGKDPVVQVLPAASPSLPSYLPRHTTAWNYRTARCSRVQPAATRKQVSQDRCSRPTHGWRVLKQALSCCVQLRQRKPGVKDVAVTECRYEELGSTGASAKDRVVGSL